MINQYQKNLLVYLIVLFVYWALINTTSYTTSFFNYLYSFFLCLIPLYGGIIGISKSKIWGGMQSALGKAVFFISSGLISWGIGGLIWSYYNFFLKIPAPYPSWADIGFAPSIFLYGIGIVFLSKATGAGFGLKSKTAKFFTIIAPIIIFILSYYVLITIARNGVLISNSNSLLKSILDIAYPLGDFISLTIAIIISGLSFKYIGGIYKFDVISILLGVGIMFLGDFSFSYTTTIGTYYNGNLSDLILTVGLFFFSFGIAGFSTIKENTLI